MRAKHYTHVSMLKKLDIPQQDVCLACPTFKLTLGDKRDFPG